MLPVVHRCLTHGYGEALGAELACYSLEEIAAEKLRTLLQAQKRLENGGWLRDCSRDYYDLWRLSCGSDTRIDSGTVAEVLPQKCRVRGVAYESADDFLSETLLSQAERRWANSLVNLVKPLPPFGRVIEELRRHLLSLLAGAGSPGLFGRPES